MDDFTYARILFGRARSTSPAVGAGRHAGARQSAGGAPPLSTATGHRAVADTLVALRELLELYPDLATSWPWLVRRVQKAEAIVRPPHA